MGKFGLKKSGLSFLPENWHKWYLRGADSESGHRFSKFRSQNSHLGKFGSKKSKLSVLSENWHTLSWKSWFRIRSQIFEIPTSKSLFGQIWPKKSISCLFLFETLLLFLDILLLHFTAGSESARCLYFYFMVDIYIRMESTG